jgi:isopenicillin N synthase-like dioxygenase
MRRWTNEEWLSTLHRVIIPDTEISAASEQTTTTSTKRRQSLAFFHNINRDAVVECLLLTDNAVAKHKPIIAGDFLMQKHLASIGSTAQ